MGGSFWKMLSNVNLLNGHAENAGAAPRGWTFPRDTRNTRSTGAALRRLSWNQVTTFISSSQRNEIIYLKSILILTNINELNDNNHIYNVVGRLGLRKIALVSQIIILSLFFADYQNIFSTRCSNTHSTSMAIFNLIRVPQWGPRYQTPYTNE